MGDRAAATLRWRQVLAWRARRHHLHRRAPRKDLQRVVTDVVGLHAQLMSSAELTAWARVDGLDPGDVGQALWDERTLVKTWAMRGTLHLLPAADFASWQAALATRGGWEKDVWLRNFGITRDELEELIAAVGEALAGPPRSREELAADVARITGSPAQGDRLRSSWGAFLKPAAARGQLCFAPSRGQLVCFTRPDRWLPAWPHVDPDAAVRAVTTAFLAASGPASREDLARWWGIPSPARAQRMIEGLGDAAVQVQVEGSRCWMLADHLAGAQAAEPVRTVRLLPAFDQYVVTATKHVDALLPGPFADRIYRPQGWLSPVLLVDGRFAGTWRHARAGRRLQVEVTPFGSVPARVRRGVADEAARLADYLGGTLDLTWPG